MAKAQKKKTEKKASPKPKRDSTYEDKLSVKGSFMDIMKASGKHANNHSAKKNP